MTGRLVARILSKIPQFAVLASLVGIGAAQATETVTASIDALYASGGTNYGYRVYLAGGVRACSGTTNNTFAYTNVTDDNYKAYITNLTLAYALGNQVSVVTETINGYCHILEVSLRH